MGRGRECKACGALIGNFFFTKEATMQKDMHFYGVYALARAAGVKDATALTLARASQFVDDATDDDVVNIKGKTVLSTMTSHKTLDIKNAIPGDQWRIWIPFHFLPGDEPKDGSFDQRMICRKNSGPAQQLKAFTLDPKNADYRPHLIGIAAHVYADTFSHFGFTGYSCKGNRVKEYTVRVTGERARNIARFAGKLAVRAWTTVRGFFAEAVPVGHGAVGIFPDHPSISWTFEYEDGPPRNKTDTDRNNQAGFLEGCKCLHEFFQQFLAQSPNDKDSGGGKTWEAISPAVAGLLEGKSTTDLDERIDRWRKAIQAGKFCEPTERDRNVHYDEHCWDLEHCAKQANDPRMIEDARRFIRAAYQYRDYVLHELLPERGLITY
jgi:hypothetical protein